MSISPDEKSAVTQLVDALIRANEDLKAQNARLFEEITRGLERNRVECAHDSKLLREDLGRELKEIRREAREANERSGAALEEVRTVRAEVKGAGHVPVAPRLGTSQLLFISFIALLAAFVLVALFNLSQQKVTDPRDLPQIPGYTSPSLHTITAE